MNERGVEELRRRFRPEKNSVTHIRGRYVSEVGESVTQFDQSLALMTQEETETLLVLLRCTLSEALGKDLLDLSFGTRQMVEGEERRQFMRLRDIALKDEEAVGEFFQLVRQSLILGGSYLILLVYSCHDVSYRAKGRERQGDAAAEMYPHLLCSIYPVKQIKPALSYHVRENEFHNRRTDWLVSPPELGFLFLVLNDRNTSLYNALYYTRDGGENHPELVEAVFRREASIPAAVQKETFQTLSSDTLVDECNYEVIQAAYDQLCELMKEHRERKGAEPLTLSKGAVKCVLKSRGVFDSHMEGFAFRHDNAFGADMAPSPRNLVKKQTEVRTPSVVIKVSPERSGLVGTRVIDGIKHILIRVDGGVKVNGVPVHIVK